MFLEQLKLPSEHKYNAQRCWLQYIGSQLTELTRHRQNSCDQAAAAALSLSLSLWEPARYSLLWPTRLPFLHNCLLVDLLRQSDPKLLTINDKLRIISLIFFSWTKICREIICTFCLPGCPADIQLLFVLSDWLESNFFQQISITLFHRHLYFNFVESMFWSWSSDFK